MMSLIRRNTGLPTLQSQGRAKRSSCKVLRHHAALKSVHTTLCQSPYTSRCAKLLEVLAATCLGKKEESLRNAWHQTSA